MTFDRKYIFLICLCHRPKRILNTPAVRVALTWCWGNIACTADNGQMTLICVCSCVNLFAIGMWGFRRQGRQREIVAWFVCCWREFRICLRNLWYWSYMTFFEPRLIAMILSYLVFYKWELLDCSHMVSFNVHLLNWLTTSVASLCNGPHSHGMFSWHLSWHHSCHVRATARVLTFFLFTFLFGNQWWLWTIKGFGCGTSRSA